MALSSSDSSTTGNVYDEAFNHVSNVRSFVTDAITDAREWAEQARASASSTIGAIGDFNPDYGNITAPDTPNLNLNVSGSFDLPSIDPASFGTINASIPGAPGMKPIRDIPDIDIAPYVPSVTGLNIPDAPTLSNFTAPDAPTLGNIDLPNKPVLTKPAFPSLAAISIPDFKFPTLPLFTDDAPEFQGTAVSTVLQWSEPTYYTEVLDEVIGKLRDLWAGSGIPPAVENALWERAASREDLDLSRQMSALEIDHSGRGFTMPTGVLEAQKAALRDEAMLKKQTANRDIAIRMAEIHIENVKFACEQGVAAENVLYGIFNNTAQRQFEAAKIQLDAELARFNAQVSLFNAQQQAYSTKADVYKVKLDAELSRIEVFKAELEGELAKGQLNEQQVKIYSEQIRALLTDVEVYKAEMQGASLQADVNRNLIEGYKAEVTAYAEKLRADKARFDAYDSQVKGELGKAQLLDAEARAYASYVSGQSAVADIGIKRMDADIRENEQTIRAYVAQLDAAKAEIMAQSEAIKASAEAYRSDTQRYVAQAGAEESKFRVELAAKEVEIRSTIGIYETEIKRYIADIEKMTSMAQMQLEALKAAGQVSSTMAAGAMAGINIGANLSGSGGVSASGSNSNSTSRSRSIGYSANYETDSGPVPGSWSSY